MFTVLADTGLRHNEMCRLRWDGIDLEQRTITTWRKKNEVQSVIRMTGRLYAVMKRRSQFNRHPVWVFTNRKRNRHRSDITTKLNAVLRRAGTNKTVHKLRSTYATKLLRAGPT